MSITTKMQIQFRRTCKLQLCLLSPDCNSRNAQNIPNTRFALGGAEWRFIRNKLSPTFTTGKIKNMFGAVVETCNELVNVISSGKKYETRDLCGRYICDVIGNVAFGMDCQALKHDHSELLETGAKIFKMNAFEALRFFFLNSFIEFGRFFNLRLLPTKYTNFFVETVRHAIKQREENNIKRQDFLNSLIQLKNTGTIDGETVENDKKLTFNQIVAEAFLFFFGG